MNKYSSYNISAHLFVFTWSTVSFSSLVETEPLSHTENGVSNDDSTKDTTPSTRSLHNASDYRAAKKERPYYPGQTHTPPPLRRVSSNPTELGPMCAQRRVEGRVKCTHTFSLPVWSDCSGLMGDTWSNHIIIYSTLAIIFSQPSQEPFILNTVHSSQTT